MAKRKILVIRYMPLLGAIESLPAMAAIRKFHKDDEVYVLTEQSLVKFFRSTRFFDKIWLDAKPYWFQPRGVVDLMKRLRKGDFDLVYDLQNDERSKWYFRLIGFKKPNWNSSVLTWCSHPYTPQEGQTYRDILHDQVRVTGIKAVPLINISYLANNESDPLDKPYAMICAGGDPDKIAYKWHPSRYAEVIDYLYEKHGIKSVLVGDNVDIPLASMIFTQCIKTKPYNYCGKTSLNGVVSIAKNAVFCLGNDTADTHIAAYAGCQTLMFCSAMSPPDIIAPKVKNIAAIDFDNLDDAEVEVAIQAIEEFGLIPLKSSPEPFKTVSNNELVNPDLPPLPVKPQ